MAGTDRIRHAVITRLNALGVPVRLALGWVIDLPLTAVSASIGVSIETAIILTVSGIQAGLREDPTNVRLMFTLWATVLFAFIALVGFVLLSLERYFNVMEKAQEFGILKILGASIKFYLLLLLLETLAICIPATGAGIALACVLKIVFALGFPRFLRLDVVYSSWPIALAITASSSMIGGIIGARKAINDGIRQALS